MQVYWVEKRMAETGCDLFIDVHGDEALPYNFIAGNEGIPAWDDRLQRLQVIGTRAIDCMDSNFLHLTLLRK